MPGGAAGLQNQSGGRKAPGGFDSLPSPPRSDAYQAPVTEPYVPLYWSLSPTTNRVSFVSGSKYDVEHSARE